MIETNFIPTDLRIGNDNFGFSPTSTPSVNSAFLPNFNNINWKDIVGYDLPEDSANQRKIFAQASAPTIYYKEGDIWFDTDDDNTIYRADSSLNWVSVKDGTIAGKITTFRQASVPTALAAGDIWFDSDDNDKCYVATSAGDDEIKAGEWERVDVGANPSLIDVLNTTNAPAEANADVTSANTAADTTNVNSIPSTQVQPRAETFFKKIVFNGYYTDGLTESVTNYTITRLLLDTTMFAGSTTGSALMESGNLYTELDGTAGDWQHNLEFSISAKLSRIITQDVFLGLYDEAEAAPAVDATSILNHIGFYITDGTLYASNADGSTQTTTEITGITLTNMNFFRFEFLNGVSCKFYVNDVLKATHTTNLPSTDQSPGIFIWVNSTAITSTAMTILNNYLLIKSL